MRTNSLSRRTLLTFTAVLPWAWRAVAAAPIPIGLEVFPSATSWRKILKGPFAPRQPWAIRGLLGRNRLSDNPDPVIAKGGMHHGRIHTRHVTGNAVFLTNRTSPARQVGKILRIF